jgi:hypothetical protein
MHCRRYLSSPVSRREMLLRAANGFGGLALSCLLGREADAARGSHSPMEPRVPHYRPRARSVIFLFMDGGVSQVDSFDPKPRLAREHGQPIKLDVPPTQFDNVGTVLKSPWEFRRTGQSGNPVSDLFPEIRTCVDDLAIVRSMVAEHSVHTSANFFMHTGSGLQGRPSMGAWVTYGLGSPCRDLPGFVVLNSGMIPPGGADIFNSGFLSPSYQAVPFRAGGDAAADLRPSERTPELQRGKLELIRALDRANVARSGADEHLEAAIENYELAFRMQAAVPGLIDLSGETPATRALYGLDDPHEPTALYARQCLLARRLVERGVRFIELLCPNVGTDRWDQHSDLRNGHAKNARAVDRPIAGLLKDLKSRGLLEETLVVWAGEFGRTPMAQGSDGRDHNPFGFTIWMAGGGVKGGTVYGATDDYGYFAVENRVTVHDLHATILHLLGMDHTRLTYRFSGRDMRLTDVSGEVVRGILT